MRLRPSRLFDPPGWPWLLRHELRLARRRKGSLGRKALIGLAAIVFVLLHLVGWLVMRRAGAEAILRAAPGAATLLAAFIALMMLGSAFRAAVLAIFDRGDLDLLGASPISPATFYAVRGLGVAVSSVALLAFLWLPFAHMGAAHGHWRMLLVYPVLAASGLGCAAIAFLATLGLARAVGARRARVLAQVLGAFAGAAVVLVSQVQALLPPSMRQAWARWIAGGAEKGRAEAAGPLDWLVRAWFGEGVAPYAVTAAGIGLFVLVVLATQRAFAETGQRGEEVASSGRPSSRRPRPFLRGLARVVIAKELRIIARDPVLVGKALLQILFLIPLFVILLRQATPLAIGASGMVVIASSLAGNLAWITVSGEEAPDLVRSAPVSRERVRWLKVAAAVLPTAAILLPFIAWFATVSVAYALVVSAFALAALVSSALIIVWLARPAPARDLRLKHKENRGLNVLESFTSVGWAGACYLALVGSYYAVLPALAACAGPGIAWAWRTGND
jgi:ABC-2 type transport system permease protein